MKRGKKTIRLTESEMINLVENIVNEIKREKRNQISESLKDNKRRFLKESEEEEEETLVADFESMDEENPDKGLLNRLEKFASKFKKLPRKLMSKIKRLQRKKPDVMKNFKHINTYCPKW